MARLISLVEDASPLLREVMAGLAPHTGHAMVVGITGSPGVGKSTSTNALVGALRAAGKRVGVLAVDPSSPFSGGALLGDRVRMGDHALDRDVYIRSMASRGHLGGLAWSTPQAIRVLDAAGFDVVLVETVGVGQSEVEIAALADTTLVLLAPGMGDGIQAAKAGILEVGDLYVVNKADRDGASSLRRDLRNALAMGDRPDGRLEAPDPAHRRPDRRGRARGGRGDRRPPHLARGDRRAGPAPLPPGPPGGRGDRADPAPRAVDRAARAHRARRPGRPGRLGGDRPVRRRGRPAGDVRRGHGTPDRGSTRSGGRASHTRAPHFGRHLSRTCRARLPPRLSRDRTENHHS